MINIADFVDGANDFIFKFGPEFYSQYFMGVIAPVISIFANV